MGVGGGDRRYPYMFRYLCKNDQNNKDDIILVKDNLKLIFNRI